MELLDKNNVKLEAKVTEVEGREKKNIIMSTKSATS